MREGRLLAETSPYSLIDHFAIPSLEDIFLKLCLEDGGGDELHHGKVCVCVCVCVCVPEHYLSVFLIIFY